MNTMKARVSKGELAAGVEIEGMLLEDGTFGISVAQVCDIFGLDKSNTINYLDNLLYGELELVKAIVPPFAEAVDVVSLKTFKEIIVKLSAEGNKVAEELLWELTSLSFHELFSDAFNVKCGKKEREEWLSARAAHKRQRKQSAIG